MLPFDATITWAMILSALNAGFVWWRTRDKKLDERFAAVWARFEKGDERLKAGSDRMDRFDLRIGGLEQALKSLPGKDDLHVLQLELVRQTGSLNEMNAFMAGHAKIMERLEIIVSRHEDHLLGGGKTR